MLTKPAIFILVITVAVLWWRDGSVKHGPGVIAPDEPLQENLKRAESFSHKQYHITKVAKFDITARVLGREDYRFDRSADLIPTDLALGWGRMSDETVLSKIDISQSGRFYYWRTRELPIPVAEIVSHSANMHLIPASQYVKNMIGHVKKGNLVRFNGYLVNVKSKDNYITRSSLVRTDSGAGACEVVWVEDFQVLK